MLKNLPTKGASGGRWAKRPGARAASIAVAAALLGGLATAGSASAWDVCVNGGNPSPQVYGKGTKADPYVVCEGDSFQVTYTAQTCNDADDTGECMPTGVTYTWTPYPSSGNTDTVKYGPFTTSGLHTYTITATGTAAGFKMPNGSPCKNPPPDTKSGSDTVYVVASSSTAWTLVIAPPLNYPPTCPQPSSSSGYLNCEGSMFMQYAWSASTDFHAHDTVQDGTPYQGGCGGAATWTNSVTQALNVSVSVVSPVASVTLGLGGLATTYSQTYTTASEPGLIFEVQRQTPAWELYASVYESRTPCYPIYDLTPPNPAFYPVVRVENDQDTGVRVLLSGYTSFKVFSMCCGG